MTVLEFVNYARKFLVAVVAALGVLAVAMGDNTITLDEWLQVAIAFAGALGVFAIANKPKM